MVKDQDLIIPKDFYGSMCDVRESMKQGSENSYDSYSDPHI